MSELSFVPRYFVQRQASGEWALRRNTPATCLPQAMVEGCRIIEEGGRVFQASDGYPVLEITPLNRGCVDAFK